MRKHIQYQLILIYQIHHEIYFYVKSQYKHKHSYMYIRAHTSLKSTSWRLKTESTYLKISEVIIRILLSMLRGGSSTASGMPVSELTKRDTWAIEASDVSSTPSVAETADEVTITKMSRPSTGPPLRAGLKESWTRKDTECAVAARWLRS